MEKFSIDLRASDKGERKKVVRYLRDKGFSVERRKETTCNRYLSSFSISNRNFAYYDLTSPDESILTLPGDWDRFVGMVGKEKCLEATEEFKAGDWVTVVDWGNLPPQQRCHSVFRFKESYNYRNISSIKLRKATKTEIEEHLLKKARRRGFEVGVKYKSVGLTTLGNEACLKYNLGYHYDKDLLTDSYGGAIYCEGQWAEIIKDKVPEIGGHKLESFGGGLYKFGCKKFREPALRDLIALKPDSITIEGHKIFLSELESILEYINK